MGLEAKQEAQKSRPMAILTDFAAAAAELRQPSFRRVFWRSLAIAGLAYLLVIVLAVKGIGALPTTHIAWLDAAIEILSGVGVLAALAFLFPAMVGLFLSFFLDDVAEAVERRHYAAWPPGTALRIGPALWRSLGFALVVVALNLVVLPLYLVTLWFPPTNLLIFYALNGYLLGRAYFELVAWRHLDRRTTGALRRRFSGRVFLAGVIIAGLFSLPLINLLAPMIATAAMVHLFYRLRPAAGEDGVEARRSPVR